MSFVLAYSFSQLDLWMSFLAAEKQFSSETKYQLYYKGKPPFSSFSLPRISPSHIIIWDRLSTVLKE